MSARVKVCGLSTPETLDAALDAGAEMIGLVHFPPSPRHVDLARGAALSARARGQAERVVLVVDPDDALLDAVVAALDPDWIQLHGAETPERVAEVRARTGRPVMKALGIATAADLARLSAYAGADRLLLDAKPPPGADRPGGNGRAFDWGLLAPDRRASVSPLPSPLDPARGFVLSGGLSPENVAEALRRTRAPAVDVSSGVERRPGEKDPDRIAAFVAAVRGSSEPVP